MKKTLPFIVAIFTCWLLSCGEPEKSNQDTRSAFVIPEDSLKQVLKDMHIVDAAAKQNFIPNNANNYNKHREYKFVLEKYNITPARFDSTLSYYASKSAQFEQLYDELVLEMKEEEGN